MTAPRVGNVVSALLDFAERGRNVRSERNAAAWPLVIELSNVLAAYERGRAIGRALVDGPRVASQPSAVAHASVPDTRSMESDHMNLLANMEVQLADQAVFQAVGCGHSV